jgi:Ca-activated chloride channel homolog
MFFRPVALPTSGDNILKIKPLSTFMILAFSIATGLLLSACNHSIGKLNQGGNEAYSRQAYDEAQIAYQDASAEDPALAEPYYNLANVLYRKGGFDQALDPLVQALSRTSDQDLAQNSLYNLGNNAYSLEDWKAAVEAYKQALLLNPNDRDAKYNLELALQQQKQQEQNQEQEQDQGQNQDPGQNGDTQADQEPQDGQESGQQSQADQNQDGQGNDAQPSDKNPDNQPWDTPQPGQKMTEEQAKQLLAALLQNAQTLQEKLGDILTVRSLPPIQDW